MKNEAPPKDWDNPQSPNNFKKYCKYCRHTMTFYAFEPDKKLCNYCGRYNYKNSLAEFKDKFHKKEREVKKGDDKSEYKTNRVNSI